MNTSPQMPPEVAEYFAKGRRKIVSVTANDDYTLAITFDNNEIKMYDMKKNLNGTVFKPLNDLSNFKRAYIDDCGCIAWDIDPNIDSDIVWSNKIDLCSDSCYIYGNPA